MSATTAEGAIPDRVSQDADAIAAFRASATVALVPAESRAQHYQRIIEAHDAERAAELRRERGQWRLVVGLGLTALALAGTLAATMPFRQVVPVFVHLNSDGTFTSTVSQSDVPQSLRRNVMASTLWLYTNSRERFSTGQHYEDQSIIFMLSDKATGDSYHQQVSSSNRDNPWRRYGTRTTVRLERVWEELACSRGECLGADPDVYRVRYKRIERTEGQGERRTSHFSVVRFRLVPRLPADQLTTFNPMGLQVVEYTPSDEGASH